VTLLLERSVPGELDTNAFDTLIPVLQGGAAGSGQASTVGKALTWTSTSGSNARHLQVLVIAQDGETRIRLEERSWEIAMAFHMGFGAGSLGLGIPGGMAAGAAIGVVAGIGVGAAIVGAFYGIGRAIYKTTTDRRRVRLEGLFAEIIERVRANVDSDVLPSPPAGALPPA
jgi:hypothetical protein